MTSYYEYAKRDLSVGINAYLSVDSLYQSKSGNALNYLSYAVAFFLAAISISNLGSNSEQSTDQQTALISIKIGKSLSSDSLVIPLLILGTFLCLCQSLLIQLENIYSYYRYKRMLDVQKIRFKFRQDKFWRFKLYLTLMHVSILFILFIVGIRTVIIITNYWDNNDTGGVSDDNIIK